MCVLFTYPGEIVDSSLGNVTENTRVANSMFQCSKFANNYRIRSCLSLIHHELLFTYTQKNANLGLERPNGLR